MLFDFFKSDAGKEVDRLYTIMPGIHDTPILRGSINFNVDETNPAQEMTTPTYYEQAGDALSDLWARASLAITPESHGESLVNQLYGTDELGRPLIPAGRNPFEGVATSDLAIPATLVSVRDSVKNTVSGITDSVNSVLIKYGIIAVGVFLAAIFVYAFGTGTARRIVK
jgi:hypothetical protein